jgi:hypothetical protein
LGRFGTLSLDNLIDKRFECNYEMMKDGTLRLFEEEEDVMALVEEIAHDNRELCDTNTAQLLTQEDIEKLKNSNAEVQVKLINTI